jgi:hypothetical protein
MLPLSIQILHALENHDHVICTSLTEQHLHQENADCDDLHKQLSIFTLEFTSHLDVIPSHFYGTTFIDKPQITTKVYYSKRTSRGPPNFII